MYEIISLHDLNTAILFSIFHYYNFFSLQLSTQEKGFSLPVKSDSFYFVVMTVLNLVSTITFIYPY